MPDPSPRLLIADDEAPQMNALCLTLRDHGYETRGVGSGEAALAVLKESKFDLLLTDLRMPGMDGVSLLRAALAADPDMVAVVMTGHGTIGTAVAAMKEGALDYILKPFKVSAILPVLSRALAMRRLRLENAALQERVRERTLELEAANESLDAFASSVAHDLHTPTRHIAAFARLILDQHASEMSPAVRDHLAAIAASAERMGKLVADLLAFSRLARAELKRQPVDLGALAGRVWAELELQRSLEPAQRDRSIVWKLSSMPTVAADESMLRQVFFNLLSNAAKYTRHRNPAVIEAGCRGPEDGGYVFYVRDNGAGFDPAGADRLFGMFQRLHRTEEFEGNGVGLANVRRIVQRHGGRAWAEGEVDKGATFYFSLPG